jgi:hypothetical protein
MRRKGLSHAKTQNGGTGLRIKAVLVFQALLSKRDCYVFRFTAPGMVLRMFAIRYYRKAARVAEAC